jgi:hypothetical protein
MSGSGQVTRLRSKERAGLQQCLRARPIGNLLSKADTGVPRPAERRFGAKNKKDQEYACNREIRRYGLLCRSSPRRLMTKIGDQRHGQGLRQSHCPVSDMIDCINVAWLSMP